MAQDFGFTGVLGKQAHSRLRNWFSSAAVTSKDKSDSGIIEFSFLRQRAINNLPHIAQDFCLSSRRRNRHIAGYVTISTTQKKDKKTCKMGGVFVASCLSNDA